MRDPLEESMERLGEELLRAFEIAPVIIEGIASFCADTFKEEPVTEPTIPHVHSALPEATREAKALHDKLRHIESTAGSAVAELLSLRRCLELAPNASLSDMVATINELKRIKRDLQLCGQSCEHMHELSTLRRLVPRLKSEARSTQDKRNADTLSTIRTAMYELDGE